MRKISNLSWARLGLLVGAIAIILLLIPHPDRQSYSYELNQPWKYPLLTAEFDMPIMRDSMSASKMRDSIDANFIPFVNLDTKAVEKALTRLNNSAQEIAAPAEIAHIKNLLNKVYADGILDPKTYDRLKNLSHKSVRFMESNGSTSSFYTKDASEMRSAAGAFEYIDSCYSALMGNQKRLEGNVAKALNVSLSPNITEDAVSDTKYRNQEYLQVNGAQGVIKKGQRIVDRGEIITPQVYSNLNTYMDLIEKNEGQESSHTYFYLGQVLYILICFGLLYFFLWNYRWRFYNSIRKMTFLMTFITFFVVFSILMFEYLRNGLYFVPYAVLPVVILIFFDARTAIFSLLVTVMIVALVAVQQFQFIFLELLVGLVAAFSLRRLSQRSQLLRVGLYTFLTYSVGYFVLELLSTGNLQQFSWYMIGVFAVNSVILSFAYILILVIEKLFGFTSTVTLVELSDINNSLLRRLAEEAPGTFQHSMQVSTLASEAARAIGADTQLVRTGALYHDIGKLDSPVFFTENQHGINPHSGLNPETSAHKIISHVSSGLQIASKAKLPEVIREFISEHHGKSLAKYFYNTAMNQSQDGKVDASKFRYPGPNPQSKETAILMMADAVEAASRSLPDYSPESIDKLVDKIIDTQAADGLFKESPISFRDVETVKETFKKRLATIYHTRIAYPEIKK